MKYASNNIRNILIAGHAGSGKTTLTEALVYFSGAAERMGRVEDGTTISDFDPEEAKRKASLSASVVPVEYEGIKYNLIDAPGLFDFEAGEYEGIRAAESVLVCVSGRSGVTVGAEKAFQLARKNGKATMVFVSKCDLENANYFKILEDMKIRFGSTVCPCVVPAKLDDGTPVYINLFSQKAFKYEGGKQIQVDLPDIGHRFQGLIEAMSEAIAETDDDLMEKFFGGEPFTTEEIVEGMRKGVKDGLITPVFCGSAVNMQALDMLLFNMHKLLPSPEHEASTLAEDANGEPVEIITRERGEAEMMIEDFMLAANECVARFARENRLPLLYRVHEKPDAEKLAMFADFLDGIGVNAKGIRHNAAPGDIRAILEKTKERPEYSVITALALRSMQKARYDVAPLGHYGLAMADYCHFTSPIRRYPDLVVSRALTAKLTGQPAPLTGEALVDAAVRSSERERAAIDAERAADKLMMARLMAHHVGEDYDGTINGVSEYGMYITLSNGAEGFVPVRTLEDWFGFDERRMLLRGERTGTVFSLGQPVRVKVQNVELTQCNIDLTLLTPLKGRAASGQRSERKQERDRMRGFNRS